MTAASDRPQARRPRRASAVAVWTAALALTASACGGGAPGTSQGDDGAQAPAATAAPGEAPSVIRLSMTVEPLWQWLVDSGTLGEWEQRHGLRIEASNPFRPFTAFVSGHADVVLVDALDIPAFAQDQRSEAVIIGKYAADRSLAVTSRRSQAESLADTVEGKVAVASEMGSTLLWALVADMDHGLDFRNGSRDFEFLAVTLDIADTVRNGSADVCICRPDDSAAGLSEGMLRSMYGGETAAEVYEDLADAPSPPMGQVFLARRSWLEADPDAADAFLELWEHALAHWHSHAAEVIGEYPDLLSLGTDAEIAWLTGYVADHDWIAPSVYLSEADEKTYLAMLDRLRTGGFIDTDAWNPAVLTRQPASPSGEE